MCEWRNPWSVCVSSLQNRVFGKSTEQGHTHGVGGPRRHAHLGGGGAASPALLEPGAEQGVGGRTQRTPQLVQPSLQVWRFSGKPVFDSTKNLKKWKKEDAKKKEKNYEKYNNLSQSKGKTISNFSKHPP